MRDFITCVIAGVLAITFAAITAVSIIILVFFGLSIFPSHGQQNALIERVYVEGFINKTDEIKVFPLKMGGCSDHYTIEDAKVLESAKIFFHENKSVLITYHCGAWNPYKSGSMGCFADKIEEVK